MRRRVLLLVFATTLFAVTLLGTLLVLTLWAAETSNRQDQANETARIAATGLGDAVEAGATVTVDTLNEYVRDDAWLSATLPDGTVLTTGPEPSSVGATATDSEEHVSVTASIPSSAHLQTVIQQSLLVLLIALLALAGAMAVAWFTTRRLTKPFEDFADAVSHIATGDARRVDQRYGVPEIDAVAEVLDASVVGFNALLENERRTTNEVSHQLRTPLTALSLRIEEILEADDLDEARSGATAALGQLERLAGVVDEVVSVSRGHVGPVATYDVDELVASQVVEWRPAFEAAGRALRREGATGLDIEGVRGRQAQVLATLVENSLVHGGGATTIRVRPAGSWVVVEVTDEGAGVPADLEQSVFERSVSGGESTGLGLALARTLVVADGGRLEMISARPPVFAMFLPARRSVGAAAPDATSGAVAQGATVGEQPAVRPSRR